MEEKILYDFDAVTENLTGLNFIRQSGNVKLVIVWPMGDGKIRLLKEGLLNRHGQLKNGFNRNREFVKSLMPGCDYYYEITPTKDNLDLRKKLINNRTAFTVDEDGVGYIKGRVEEDALEYNPEDINNSSKTNAERITYFFEYDPLIENPSFGEIYELVKVDEDANHNPIWKMEPKILQNEHDLSYAERALEKGVRTVVKIADKDYDKVLQELIKEGLEFRLKEFSTVPGMDNDYVIERNTKQINNEIGKSL